MLKLVPLAIVLMFFTACGGSNNESTDSSGSSASQSNATTATPAKTPGGDKGIGPVDHVDIASLDATKAAAGAEVFKAKCSACHKIEERYIGPALAGVTERRKPEWILNMIMNPEEMVKEDPTAKALFVEYLAPMTNQNVPREDAEAILAYFLENDRSD